MWFLCIDENLHRKQEHDVHSNLMLKAKTCPCHFLLLTSNTTISHFNQHTSSRKWKESKACSSFQWSATRSNASSILRSIHKLMLHVPKATTTKIDLDFRIITWVWFKLSRGRTKKNPWQSHKNVFVCKHWHCTSLTNHQLPTFLHFEGGALS